MMDRTRNRQPQPGTPGRGVLPRYGISANGRSRNPDLENQREMEHKPSDEEIRAQQSSEQGW